MKKVLIANRGEIVIRVIRACRDLGLETVAVYSQADSEALHVLQADEAICIGEPPAQKSYLKISNILSACEITGADAIHPGYGFLSENAHFASICDSCGLNFIGPPHTAIALLGDKAKAKMVAKKAKCPVIPGSDGIVATVQEGLKEAKRLGFPIFIKAVGGGGGKGIRIAHNPEEFSRQFSAARTEAELSFNNPEVYLEKMIVNPRHIEVQVIGDKHGNYAYLFERDCTIQRRRQKLIEEAPSPILSDSLRKKICEAAVSVVKAAGYYSVGTVEFLLDQEKNFYFMEVNTRIQVEHTITEELTGIDLVAEQIRIAQGAKLSFRQKDITRQGHVIQFRINAEDPAHNFAPSPGRLDHYIAPGGRGVRIDSACYAGYTIPPNYDSMIAKLIVRGKDRAEAIAIGQRALKEFYIGGVKTTIPFHLYMLKDRRFLENDYPITYIDQLVSEGCNFTEKVK
jgi:acetyl-CoA carboxylase, biotin carboxylase subunit